MNADVLIVGGGVAGMRTAIELAERNVSVVLVERTTLLGGRLSVLGQVFPTGIPGPAVAWVFIAKLDLCVQKGNLQVLTGHEVKTVKRTVDGYEVTIHDHEKDKTFSVKSIIMATGMEPIDAKAIPEFGYGTYEDVVTSVQLEEMLSGGAAVQRPSDGRRPKSVVFVQCVGSRVERRGVRYCSNVCCLNAIKNASIIKKAQPDIDVFILYIDIRTNGRGYEAAYKEARKLGVRFIRGQPSLVRKEGDQLLVCGENTIMRELYEIEADLVVLSVGLRTGDESKAILDMLEQRFDEDGEVVTDVEGCRLEGPGLFIAGSLEHPKDIHDTTQSAKACALSVLNYLKRN